MNERRGSLVAGLVVLAALLQACHIPTLRQEQARMRALPQTSFLYARNGTRITSFQEQNRILVPFRDVPQVMRDAVVAIEDRRFYQHKGVDLKALLRAAYVDATSGRVIQGGSTITEQYVKNRFLTDDRTLRRKIQEAVLALQLEQRLSKNQILSRYLNTVYFGHGAYGIQAAARTYFSEPASSLNLTQASLLAGLIQAPSAYDPIDHPAPALARRNVVLGVLRQLRRITAADYRSATAAPLGLRPAPATGRYPAPYFVQFVKDWFVSNPAFGATRTDRENLLYRGGLRIHTTLDPALQRDAQRAVRQILIERTDPYAAMTVIDPRTGQIEAMVGGRDFFSKTDPVAQVNLATGGVTGRQAGSSFKPFALVAALENGIPPERTYQAPSSIQIALPPACQAPGKPVWDVHNFDGTGSGTLTVEQATIDSVNVVYAQIVRDLGAGDPCAGAAKVLAAARALGVSDPGLARMGVGHPLQAVPSAVLGAEQVNTVEMASAYATLANLGYRFPPIAVTSVTDANGRVLYRTQPQRREAVDPGVAWVADQILQKVVQFGTGSQANFGRPAIGKTGTSQRFRDAWFVGAVPQLAAAVWVGFPQDETPMVAPRTRIPQVLGGTWPAQIWNGFMRRATAGLEVLPFREPVVRHVTVEIDVSRDCLPNQFTPPYLVQPAIYVDGTQPTDRCTEPAGYRPLEVPSVIGLSADDAQQVLAGAGFGVLFAVERSDQPPGTVSAQDPPAGEHAIQASVVTVTVAEPHAPGPGSCPSPAGSPSLSPPGPPSQSPSSAPSTPACGAPTLGRVPDVAGLTQSAAIQALQEAGFGVAVFQEPGCADGRPGCPLTSGLVWRQTPVGGSVVEAGFTVTLTVDP